MASNTEQVFIGLYQVGGQAEYVFAKNRNELLVIRTMLSGRGVGNKNYEWENETVKIEDVGFINATTLSDGDIDNIEEKRFESINDAKSFANKKFGLEFTELKSGGVKKAKTPSTVEKKDKPQDDFSLADPKKKAEKAEGHHDLEMDIIPNEEDEKLIDESFVQSEGVVCVDDSAINLINKNRYKYPLLGTIGASLPFFHVEAEKPIDKIIKGAKDKSARDLFLLAQICYKGEHGCPKDKVAAYFLAKTAELYCEKTESGEQKTESQSKIRAFTHKIQISHSNMADILDVNIASPKLNDLSAKDFYNECKNPKESYQGFAVI